MDAIFDLAAAVLIGSVSSSPTFGSSAEPPPSFIRRKQVGNIPPDRFNNDFSDYTNYENRVS